MNCTRCHRWTEDPDAHGLCRGCHDYANARYLVAPVHPSHMPSVVDTLEDTIAAVRDAVDSWRNGADAGDVASKVLHSKPGACKS